MVSYKAKLFQNSIAAKAISGLASPILVIISEKCSPYYEALMMREGSLSNISIIHLIHSYLMSSFWFFITFTMISRRLLRNWDNKREGFAIEINTVVTFILILSSDSDFLFCIKKRIDWRKYSRRKGYF